MSPFWTSFGLFATFLVVESFWSWRFIRGSKKYHHVLWVHAGRPTLLGDGDLISAWGTNRYLLERRYRQLNDAAAEQFAERLRLPMLVGYFGSWLSLGAFFVCLAVFGKT